MNGSCTVLSWMFLATRTLRNSESSLSRISVSLTDFTIVIFSFLVTPKLLPDLKYSKKMRVLTVMNGDHLPQDEVDIGKILARKRALLGR
jgi:hypothetical protein